MDGGDSPVMTESERRAYRYEKASPRLQGLSGGMRKSWSNDSLSSYVGAGGRAGAANSCICAPTTHPGSFRCKHHRQNAFNLGGGAAGAPASHAHHEETASTDQGKLKAA